MGERQQEKEKESKRQTLSLFLSFSLFSLSRVLAHFLSLSPKILHFLRSGIAGSRNFCYPAARHYHHRTHMPCHDGRAFGGETQRNKFLDKTHCRRISTEEIEQNLVSKLIFRKSIRSYKLLFKMFSENKKVVYFAQKIQILLVFDDLVCQ